MKISILNKQKSLLIKAPYWRKAIKEIAALQNESFEEFTVTFVDKETIAEIHGEYFDDPTPTDCISFPIDGPDEPYRVLGEIFVCPAVAFEYAAKHGQHPEKETLLYVVHGLLHLFGYDDMTPIEKKKMRRAEKKHMDNLEQKGFSFV